MAATQTAVAADLPTAVDPAKGDTPPELAFLYGSMNFGIADNGATFGMDGHEGPGYAGMSIQVPSDKMGETYRITFWARWIKGNSSLPDTVPMVVEAALSDNDKQNGYYADGFHRRIEVLGTAWKQYVIDYQALRPRWQRLQQYHRQGLDRSEELPHLPGRDLHRFRVHGQDGAYQVPGLGFA